MGRGIWGRFAAGAPRAHTEGVAPGSGQELGDRRAWEGGGQGRDPRLGPQPGASQCAIRRTGLHLRVSNCSLHQRGNEVAMVCCA